MLIHFDLSVMRWCLIGLSCVSFQGLEFLQLLKFKKTSNLSNPLAAKNQKQSNKNQKWNTNSPHDIVKAARAPGNYRQDFWFQPRRCRSCAVIWRMLLQGNKRPSKALRTERRCLVIYTIWDSLSQQSSRGELSPTYNDMSETIFSILPQILLNRCLGAYDLIILWNWLRGNINMLTSMIWLTATASWTLSVIFLFLPV